MGGEACGWGGVWVGRRDSLCHRPHLTSCRPCYFLAVLVLVAVLSMVQPSAMTVDVGDGGACHSHQHWGCKGKKNWVGIDMLDQGYRLLSRPVLPIGNGCGRRREIDEQARDVWLVELARDWGRRGTSRVGV